MARIFVTLILPVLLTGCSNIPFIDDPKKQNITIITPYVEGASCSLTDDKGHKWYVVQTPASVTVRRGYGPLLVRCTKDDYYTQIMRVSAYEKRQPGFGDLVEDSMGRVYTPYSGPMSFYPNVIYVWLEPVNTVRNNRHEEWSLLKKEWEKKENFPVNTSPSSVIPLIPYNED